MFLSTRARAAAHLVNGNLSNMHRPFSPRVALLSAVLLALPTAGFAAEARIDFGFLTGNYTSASTSGKAWNNAVNPLGGTTKLVDYSSGSSTAWSMEITKAFNGTWDLNGATTTTGAAASGIGSANSTKDSFTAFTSFGSPQITFRNLAPTETYNFGIFASQLGGTSNRTATYTAKGATTVSGSLNAANNKSGLLSLSNVKPAANGTITLDIGAAAANNSTLKQIFLNALTLTSVKAPVVTPPPAPVVARNILFFGNSFTEMYNVPGLVAQFAAADGQLKPYVVGETLDSRTLSDQIAAVKSNPANNINKIAAGQQWDNVVIQDLSNRPTHNGDVAAFRADAVTLFNLVKAKSANVKPVLYETWAYRTDANSTRYGATPTAGQWTNADQMQAELRASYLAAKSDLDAISGNGAIFADVGDTWQQAGFSADLYDTFDDKHPSVRGAALNGLVLYANIYKQNVSDIPFAKVADWANSYGLSQADWTRLTALVDANPTLLSGASIGQLSYVAELALVPEPTSIAALLGLAATIIRRRR